MTLDQLRALAAQYQLTRPAGITNRQQVAEGSLYLYDMIAAPGSLLGGISARDVVQALADLGPVGTLHIHINSPGGDVFEAKAVYQALKTCSARKVVHVDGLAASAASFIAMAGDEIISAPQASWLIHEAMSLSGGTAADHRKVADTLDSETASIAEIYAKRTGQPVDQLRKWMAEDSIIDARTALARHLCDRIEGEEPAARPSNKASPTPALQPATPLQLRRAALRRAALDSPRPGRD